LINLLLASAITLLLLQDHKGQQRCFEMGNEFPSGHTDTQYRRSSNGAVHRKGRKFSHWNDGRARSRVFE